MDNLKKSIKQVPSYIRETFNHMNGKNQWNHKMEIFPWIFRKHQTIIISYQLIQIKNILGKDKKIHCKYSCHKIYAIQYISNLFYYLKSQGNLQMENK